MDHSVLKSYRYCLLHGFDSLPDYIICVMNGQCVMYEEAEFGKGADDKHLVEKYGKVLTKDYAISVKTIMLYCRIKL